MTDILQKLYFRSVIDTGFLTVKFNYPVFDGLFKNGLWSGLGTGLSYFFMIMIMIWIGYSIYAGYKISRSNMEDDFKTGITLIKNVWLSITVGIVFFAALSLVGGFLGVGGITQWYKTLAQCNSAAGGFYFRDLSMQNQAGVVEGKVYCCKVSSITSAPEPYKATDFQNDSWHFIIEGNSKSGFSDCTEF